MLFVVEGEGEREREKQSTGERFFFLNGRC
jgi:hypothetical protein